MVGSLQQDHVVLLPDKTYLKLKKVMLFEK